MLLPSGNPFKCHEEVLYFQLLIPPKGFDIFFPQTGGCSEGLGAFRFFFKKLVRICPSDRFCRVQNLPTSSVELIWPITELYFRQILATDFMNRFYLDVKAKSYGTEIQDS